MSLRRVFGLTLLVAALASAAWGIASWDRPVGQPDYHEILNVEVSLSSDSTFFYYANHYSDATFTLVNLLGDTTKGWEHADYVTDLNSSNFDCDQGVIVVTDSSIVPVEPGNARCIVRHGALVDTLSLAVRERGTALFVTELRAQGP